MIRLRLLGSFAMTEGAEAGRPSVRLQPKRAALLAYLVAARPRPWHRRDRLLTLFWPELDDAHARGALNKAVHHLRQRLGDGVILSRGDDEVGVSADHLWSDVQAFDEAMGQGRPEVALDLYRGELLSGFHVSDAPEFERWLDGERARLRELAVEGSCRLADRHESEGALPEAVAWVRRAVELELTDEVLFRRLLALLHRQGNRAEAVREYAAFAGVLASEYDIEPSAETRDLAAAIREGRLPLPLPSEPRSPTPPVVQRKRSRAGVDEGLAIAAESETSQRPTRLRRGLIWGVPLLIAAVAVITALSRTRSTGSGDSPATSSIAVVPFATSGPLGISGEGFAYLLGANLDGVGGIRVRSPRSVVDRWEAVDEALSIPRSLAPDRKRRGRCLDGAAGRYAVRCRWRRAGPGSGHRRDR
jgi:DNA-binding SARP family transcriptional activator